MLDQLLKLVEQSARESIVDNKAIPDQLNNAAIKEVTNQIFNGIKGQVSRGDMEQVINLFQTGKSKAPSPVITSIIETVTTSLTSKFNIAPDVAQSVADNIVPAVMSQVIKKTNDPKDIDFDLQQMLRGMSGNTPLIPIASFARGLQLHLHPPLLSLRHLRLRHPRRPLRLPLPPHLLLVPRPLMEASQMLHLPRVQVFHHRDRGRPGCNGMS